MLTDFTPKNAELFTCHKCDFLCSKMSDYMRHISTRKHKRLTNANDFTPKNATFKCMCGKKYKHMSSLCKHKRMCSTEYNINYNIENINDVEKHINEIETNKTDTNVINMIMEVVKQNSEFKELLMEQNKHIIELTSKPSINNTTNNSFNLNFFLNETCKDALNITDFVSQLKLGIKDLEETGRLGYAEGISKIFINGLKQLDISQRPLHCSDIKRETIYIKDENQWSKETDENVILTNAIRSVAHKNIQQIPVWAQRHPEYKDISSKYNDKYMKLVSEAMPGSTREESDKNYKKIVRNIMKESVIEK